MYRNVSIIDVMPIFIALLIGVPVAAACAAAAVYMFSSARSGGMFELPEGLTRAEITARIRALRGSDDGRRLAADFLLCERYCKKAYSVLLSKTEAGKPLERYERIFAENYMLITSSVSEVRRGMRRLMRLPARGEGGVAAFADLVTGGFGENADSASVAAFVAALSARKPLSWSEIRALPTAFGLARLRRAAVYASKILYRMKSERHARRDAARGKADNRRLYDASYVKAYEEAGGKTDGFPRSVYSARAEDAEVLSRYGAGMETLVAGMRSEVFTDEFLVSLSAAADVYCTRTRGFECLTTQTRVFFLSLTEKKAAKCGIQDAAMAERIAMSAERDGEDISEYLIPRPNKAALPLRIAVCALFAAAACALCAIFLPFPCGTVCALLSLPAAYHAFSSLSLALPYSLCAKQSVPELMRGYYKERNTAIVVCAALSGREDLERAYSHLMTNAAANRDKMFSYCLLADCISAAYAPSEAASDAAELNAPERVSVLIRKRPRDRKRGAIADFNSAVLSGDYSSFFVSGTPESCEYAVVLDTDTFIADAAKLVGIAEHPYNRRYAVMTLDMRVAVGSMSTHFSRLMNDGGMPRYSPAVTGALSTLHGFSCFSGKGIYRISEFAVRTGSAFPEEKLLSHDFAEGALAGCGDSGIIALESCPKNSAAYYAREERWIRGDIQCLPHLRKNAPDANGVKRGTAFPAAAKAVAADNVIRAVFPLMSLSALIVAVVCRIPAAAALALLPYILPFVFSFTSLFADPRRTAKTFLRSLIDIVYLPHTAFVYTAAVLSALKAMATGRGLMRWNTFTPSYGVRPLFIANLAAGSVCAAFFAIHPSVYSATFALLFLLALPVDMLICREDTIRRITKEDMNRCTALAEKTWQYFLSAFDASGSGMPPDNRSDDNGWAMRTSPTDIGMALSAAVCACDMGITDERGRDEFIGKILTAYSKLEKYRGCPYNWYDAKSGAKLHPAYISSVDCGNLTAALFHVASTGGKNAEAALGLINNMDMTFLFKGSMLRIGYNADAHSADAGIYDLLASESALTYLMTYATGASGKDGYMSLSRRALKYKGAALASWTGGVFEYLLPLLYMPAPRHSLLYESAYSAIRSHAAYAKECGSPIAGASESLYAERHDNGDYAYRAFGCPHIALAPPDGKKVFAPYAGIMCAAFTRDASETERLADNYGGRFGLYDALDTDADVTVRSEMTHHQGMVMMSLCELCRPGATAARMKNFAGIRAAFMLLEEPADAVRRAARKPATSRLREEERGRRGITRGIMPDYSFLTNGSYRLIIDAHGRGASFCRGLCVSRFDEPDGLRIQAETNGRKEDLTEYSECMHYGDRSVFVRNFGGIAFETCAAVIPGKNAEIRRICCRNSSGRNAVITFFARDIPCLTGRTADLAHKTFSRMFISTAYDERGDYVRAMRKGEENMSALYCSIPAEYCGDERFALTGKGMRFGATTEAALYAKTTVVLAPGEEKKLSFVLACGVKGELDMLARAIRNRGYAEYCIAGARSAPRDLGMPAAFAEAASAIIAGGESKGVPPRITLTVSERDAVAAVAALRNLKEAALYGAVCDVSVLSRISPESPSAGLIREAAEKFGRCEISDISGGITEHAAEAMAAGKDLRSLRNISLPPLPSLPCRPFPQTEPARRTTEYPLGIGGFTSDGGYFIDAATPSPWYNVMSDGSIGCLVSDRGEYTFAANAREEKLTYHSCDELNDVPGDGVIFGEGGCLWSTSRTAVPLCCEYTAYHGKGYSELSCGYNAVRATRRVYIENGVKYSRITLENARNVRRRIRVMYFAELVLGDMRCRTAGGVKCGRYDGGIYASDGSLSVYLTADRPPAEYSFRSESYRDGAGHIAACRGLCEGGITPALAYSCGIILPPAGKTEIVFALSVRPVTVTAQSANEAFARVAERYAELSPVVSDEKPVGYYLQSLAYQTLVARFTAKCGFQQPGGATGFRDALQDSTALIGICPSEVRALLLKCAARQFEEGDVLHWWHEPAVGVRTRICDDKLFLPYAAAEYMERTGDLTLLSEKAAYLEGKPVPDGQSSLYASFSESHMTENFAAHVMRAFRSVKLSKRGLVLMGGGDWNDGMDGVGRLGKGESVWCTMFAYYAAGRWMRYAGEEDSKYLALLRARLKKAIAGCKRGNAYLRAIDDEGNPIGAGCGNECRADLLVAAWAVLSGIEKGESARKVLEEAYNSLYDAENRLIKLLDPPFTDPSVGYIADYPPGVRENGGQYTHAAVWFVCALFEADMDEPGCRLMHDLLPSSHSSDAEGCERYMKEPYVMAGDVYSGALAGRGGWTWYTGSAGWMYRTIIELYYGIDIRAGKASIRPHMTKGEADVTVRAGGSSFTVKIRADGTGKRTLAVGNAEYPSYVFGLRTLNGKEVVVYRGDEND